MQLVACYYMQSETKMIPQHKSIYILTTCRGGQHMHQFMFPQIACPDVTLLLGLAVNSYRIRANVSEYFPSDVRISAKLFSWTRRCILFWGSETRLSSITAAFLQTSDTGCGAFTIFRSLSTALFQWTLKQQQIKICVAVCYHWPNQTDFYHRSLASFNLQSMFTSDTL